MTKAELALHLAQKLDSKEYSVFEGIMAMEFLEDFEDWCSPWMFFFAGDSVPVLGLCFYAAILEDAEE